MKSCAILGCPPTATQTRILVPLIYSVYVPRPLVIYVSSVTSNQISCHSVTAFMFESTLAY